MKSTENPTTAAEFQREEERVEQRSAVFKKELGLTDLALTQILFIVGLPWIGVAAKQGPSRVPNSSLFDVQVKTTKRFGQTE